MKIVIVGPAYPYRGGIAKFNEVLADNFVKRGDHVDIVNFTMQYPSFLFPGKTQYTTDKAPEDGFSIRRIVSSINPYTWFKAAREIRSLAPDMVIIRYWMPFFGPALGTIARGVKCPVVALADNIVPHEGHFYDRICTKYFLRGVDAAVYMSRQVGGELTQFGFRGPTAFSPHPIYDTYGPRVSRIDACRAIDLDPAYRYSLFFGFIRHYKGLDLLLRAWADLADDTLRLVVAGEYYGNREMYEALIAELGLEDRIIVRESYIPDSDVKYYFSAADMVIQPYRTATQSGVTQIAYHFGTPMLVTDVGGLAEIVPHGRVGYVVGQSSDEIRHAVTDFYANRREDEFRRNIEVEKRRFEWSKMTETFVNLLDQIKK